MRLLLALAGVLAVLAACGRSEPADRDRPAAGSIARGGADPLGPCTWIADGQCRKHEALFAEASASPNRVTLGAQPVESGRQHEARAYFAAVTAAPGTRIRIAVEALDATVPAGGRRFRIRRWESRVDGWKVSEDAFNTAEPGARFSQLVAPETDGVQLIAVLAEPPGDFAVRFSTE